MSERKRSHWAWGWEDKLPDLAARQGIGQMVGAMLGFQAQAPIEARSVSSIELGAPQVAAPQLSFVRADDDARIRHTYGRAYPDIVRGYYGDFAVAPDLVAFPTTEAEVVATLEWADAAGVAVIPFGGGTSVVGGVEAPGDRPVVSLDLGGLGRILEVDDVSRAARIEAGIFGPALEDALRPNGLTLRHFPQSFEFSTLGGWIATRSGGHFATVRTHIDEFVEAMRVVTPGGVVETRRLPGSGAGPDPNRLFIGSEGIFGIITEAWMRLQERPRYRAQASVRFADYRAAVRAVRALAQSGLDPANCRLLDSREAMLNQVVFDGSHVLIIGFESHDHPLDAWMKRALELAADFGGSCPDGAVYRDSSDASADAAGKWRNAFFDGPYLQSALVTMGVCADTFETACTWDRFDDFHAGVIAAMRDAMQRVCGTRGFISCRFTHVYPDGPAPYYTYIAPVKRGSELVQWKELKAAAMEAVVGLGGTVTHHHAVGRIHRPGYAQERPDLFAAMLRAAKNEVDPNNVMNPGVLIPG